MEYKAKLDGFTLGRKLGSGYSGKVREAVNETGRYAIKYIDPKKSYLKDRLKSAEDEYTAMLKMNHPNITKMYGYNKGIIIKENGKTVPVTYLVFELITGGELYDYIIPIGAFSEKLARHYFKQLIEALSYVHSKGFCHRDIKAENLLMDENYNLKLSDFGFSVPLSGSNGSGLLHSGKGSPYYKAPEIIRGKPYLGEKADFFSAGVLLFIMVYRYAPFKAATLEDPNYKKFCYKNDLFWESVTKKTPPGTFTTELRSLINELLDINPAVRPSLSEIKSH